MKKIKKLLESLKKLKNEKGASAVEYSLLVALIACAIIGTVWLLGQKVNSAFTYVANTLPSF